jgi:hypothetical protein
MEVNTFDHLNALIKDKKPTGYFTEPGNLVPSCTSCNSSKRNKKWEEFLEIAISNSKKKNDKVSIDQKQYELSKNKLEAFEENFRPRKIDFNKNQEISNLLNLHEQNLEKMLKTLKKAKIIENNLINLLEAYLYSIT